MVVRVEGGRPRSWPGTSGGDSDRAGGSGRLRWSRRCADCGGRPTRWSSMTALCGGTAAFAVL